MFYSDRFVSNINVPFLVLQAKDDPICTLDNMPMNDLLKNPNCFVIKLKHGGHCDFFTKMPGSSKNHRVSLKIIYFKQIQFYPVVAMNYFEEVQNFEN
jgi:predicted alpha/beta-fold hydrolase